MSRGGLSEQFESEEDYDMETASPQGSVSRKWKKQDLCWSLPTGTAHSPQLPEVHTNSCDNISQFSVDSITSQESKEPMFIAAGDIRYGQPTWPLIFPSLFQALPVAVSPSSLSAGVLVLRPPDLKQWRCRLRVLDYYTWKLNLKRTSEGWKHQRKDLEQHFSE